MRTILRSPGAAFLDRDGTINTKAPVGAYIERPEELRLLPRVGPAIRRLNEAGIKVLVVTNQRGIALGRLTVEGLKAIHDHLGRLLEYDAGAHIDDFLFCPHEIGACSCRKPEVGMFLEAAARWPEIDLHSSAIIGDSRSDVEAGHRLDIVSIQLGRDVPDLWGAVDRLMNEHGA